MAAAASPEEVQDFLDNVDEAARLIGGLVAGTLPPDYVDRRADERAQKQQQKQTQQRQKQQQHNKQEPPGDAENEDDSNDQAAARRAELMRKVEELKAGRERKLKARAKYDAYVRQKQQQQGQGQQQQVGEGDDDGENGTTGAAAGAGVVDYVKWDLWCPSDDDDELFSGVVPRHDAAFRAMERDIDERHARMVRQRQLAERARAEGNAAMARRQWGEALRCYEAGLEAQRHDLALLAGAALAALKAGAPTEALERCDHALHAADALYGRPRDPLCVKVLLRRAAANEALGRPGAAVGDLERALDVAGGADREVEAALARARLLAADAARQRRAAKAGGGALSEVERLVRRLQRGTPGQQEEHGDGGGSSDSALTLEEACSKLADLVAASEDAGTCFRTCGGLAAAAAQLLSRALAAQPALPGKGAGGGGCGGAGGGPLQRAQVALLGLLEAVCRGNAVTCEQAAGDSKLLGAVVKLLSASSGSLTHAAALRLLLTSADAPQPRASVCAALAAHSGAGMLHLLSLATAPAGAGGDSASSQALALCLAAACMVEASARTAAAALLMQPQHGSVLAGIVAAAAGLGGSRTGTRAVAQEQAFALITNMCRSDALRRLLAADGTGAVAAAAAAAAAAAIGVPAAHGDGRMQEAAAGCLLNLCAEPSTQQLLARQTSMLSALLDRACRRGSGSGDDSSALLAERAAGVVARVAKQPDGAAALSSLGAVARLAGALAAAGLEQQSSSCAAWADAAVRTLAQLTARPGFAAACDPAAAKNVIAAALPVVLAACSDSSSAAAAAAGGGGATNTTANSSSSLTIASAAGNAALALGHLAAEPGLRGALLEAGAVDALARLMARAGRGAPAARNAAIALAKAAPHAGVAARLRELRAVEVMYAYVRP